jgi:hypothetical protein
MHLHKMAVQNAVDFLPHCQEINGTLYLLHNSLVSAVQQQTLWYEPSLNEID